MSTPPFLLAVTLLFWGWQTGYLVLGILAAVLLEGSRLVHARWSFAQADLDRVFNLTVLLFFGSAVVLLLNNDTAGAVAGLWKNQSLAARSEVLSKSARSVIRLFAWMPLTFLPIALAQAYSAQPRMSWSTFSWWLRRQRGRRSPGLPSPGINVLWPYFALCLISASAANERAQLFPAGLSLLVGWALWSARPARFHVRTWSLCLCLALALGFVVQLGMRGLQHLVQRLDAAFVARLAGGGLFSDREHRTMIGEIGRLKFSGSIVLRVESEDQPPPRLLREASYNLFRSPIWATSRQEFSELTSETNLTTTVLLPNQPGRQSAIVSGYFPSGKGILPLPLGARQLDDLIADVSTNQLGVARIANGPGFARFKVAYQEGASIDAGVTAEDTDVPNMEKPAVGQIVSALGLRGRPAAEQVGIVNRFFADQFRYTTWLGLPPRTGSNQTALARFLLETRAGHCEYFATATTLLLREAGVPARYAMGYAVQELKGKFWIVRDRHAHAWCLAWFDHAWHNIDTTPASWAEVEDSRRGWWEHVADVFSRLWFEFSKWRWATGDWKHYLTWLLLPLLGLAVWRLMSRKQWSRTDPDQKASVPAPPSPGMDSEFYRIERELLSRGLERRPGETLSTWLARLHREGQTSATELGRMLALHYRLRFDPAGLDANERASLHAAVAGWMEAADATRPASR